jgi:hypothetical protein
VNFFSPFLGLRVNHQKRLKYGGFTMFQKGVKNGSFCVNQQNGPVKLYIEIIENKKVTFFLTKSLSI